MSATAIAIPETPTADLKEGQVVYNSWGYDQTNIDFYEIVKVTRCFVSLRRLEDVTEETGFMCGNTIPVLGHYNDRYPEITRHKVTRSSDGQAWFNFEHGAGRLWNGQPMRCSWYA